MATGKSARQFNLDLKKFGKVTRVQAEKLFRKVILDLDTAIVLKTPVDTGRARSNWFPSVSVPSGALDENLADVSGGISISRAAAIVTAVKLGDIVWLTNNISYILDLENGTSQQAPNGMVALSILEVQSSLA